MAFCLSRASRNAVIQYLCRNGRRAVDQSSVAARRYRDVGCGSRDKFINRNKHFCAGGQGAGDVTG